LSEEKLWTDKLGGEDEWNSHCKFDKLFESEASRRQNTQEKEVMSEELPSQWESLPLSVEAENMNLDSMWEGHTSSNQLREITNEVEKERQSKTKMFLEEFRKTFNKCLNSGNVSRKNSKNMARPPKDRSRTMGTTFGKVESEKEANQSNEKMITDMLKDLDNNHKFSVGNRRS